VAAPGEPVPAFLNSAAAMVSSLLRRHEFLLAEPVKARFRTNEHGSCGIEVSVRLRDPIHAGAARALLRERFGAGGVDVFNVG
jgi:hypothetical protein